MASKYVPVKTVQECRAAASAGVLYWCWPSEHVWHSYNEDREWAVSACDDAWECQLRIYCPSILVEDDDDG